MALEQLTTKNLHKLDDGVVAAMLDTLLAQAAEDCRKRAGTKKSRSVTLKLELTPQLDDAGNVEGINLEVAFDIKVPSRRTRTLNLGIRNGGILTFNPLSPDNAKQKTLDEQTGGTLGENAA